MLDFINNAVDKINKENKYGLLLGGLNIDLLKFDSHPGTDEFINTSHSIHKYLNQQGSHITLLP